MSLKDRTDSLWESVSLPRFSSLDKNITAGICVIGGGICGVSTAYQLAKRGHRVTLVDAFRIGSGQTCRTTAHLSTQLEEEFNQLLKFHDPEVISLFHDSQKTAIDTIEQVVLQEGISCDFTRVPGYLFLGRNEKKSYFDKEQKAAEKCGVNLEFIQEAPYLREKVPALKFANQGQFHPLKYLNGLLRVLKDLGVEIYEDTMIKNFQNHSPESTTLTTDAGYEIEARYVVVATDTPINTRFHIHTKQYAYRTYSMSFKSTRPLEGPVLLWDTEDPYHYIRFEHDNVIIGAEDHRTGQAPERDPFANLEKWSRANFDFLGEVNWRWSGQVFEPNDQLPYIGKSPTGEENIFIATGFSGIGMTNGTVSSLLISDLIEGKKNPWAEIFDPARSAGKNHLTEFIKENVNVAVQYTDYFTSGEVEKKEDIPEDHGCLIRQGLIKACVYHESGDKYESKTAICTHLGGIVHWNDIEKTWDCPAHGSRFNTHGKPIEGPAVTELKDQ